MVTHAVACRCSGAVQCQRCPLTEQVRVAAGGLSTSPAKGYAARLDVQERHGIGGGGKGERVGSDLVDIEGASESSAQGDATIGSGNETGTTNGGAPSQCDWTAEAGCRCVAIDQCSERIGGCNASLANSVVRGANDKFFYFDRYNAQYEREFPSHFSVVVGGENRQFRPAGALLFEPASGGG